MENPSDFWLYKCNKKHNNRNYDTHSKRRNSLCQQRV